MAQQTHWPCAGSMLGQRRRRSANIEPTHGQCLLFAGGMTVKWYCVLNTLKSVQHVYIYFCVRMHMCRGRFSIHICYQDGHWTANVHEDQFRTDVQYAKSICLYNKVNIKCCELQYDVLGIIVCITFHWFISARMWRRGCFPWVSERHSLGVKY